MRTQELQYEGFTFTINWLHTGQYRPYGDSFYVAEVVTFCTDETITIGALRTLDSSMPRFQKAVWDAMSKDAGTYFEGWFTLEKTPTGWKYTECKPYTD